MLKSDQSPSSASASMPKADGRVSGGKTFDGLMSSFTIKTHKPWTMVQGYDDQLSAKKASRSLIDVAIQPNKPIHHSERASQHRQLAPRMPVSHDPPPYALGARRASANGDRAWIESFGLIPNHNFKATKIIQHYPATVPIPPVHTPSPVETTARRSNPPLAEHARSNSVPSVSPVADAQVHRRNLTFHCLQFDNGTMRPAHDGQGTPLNATTFVPSEYQHQLAPERPAKRSRSAERLSGSGEASLEAAQLLLDFTKIANA